MEGRTRNSPPEVTERQRAVARLVAQGMTNAEIAEQLGISRDGAKYHVSELLTRLGFRRRREIAQWYRQEEGPRAKGHRLLLAIPMKWLAAGTATLVVATIGALAIGALHASPGLNEAALRSSAPASLGHLERTGSLNTPRIGHTATVLADGRVLIAGGDGVAATTAEIFEAGAGRFELIGETQKPRSGHTATELLDGRVLLVGGELGAGTAEIFDPSDSRFEQVGAPISPRVLHAAVRLVDGKVLIVGGAHFPQPSAELFDPTSNTFVSISDLHDAPRQGATATLLEDGRVLIAGGCCDESHSPWRSLEIYDPVTQQFQRAGDLQTGSMVHTAVSLSGSRVWFSTGETYDADMGQLSPGFDARIGRHASALLPDGTAIVVGGFGDYESGTSGDLTRFDPYSGQIMEILPLAQARHGATLSMLEGGTVLIVGGGVGGREQEPTTPLDSAELYHP